MERVEFLESLSITQDCNNCGVVFRPAYWEVQQCGPGEWLGICFHQCEACQHFQIAAAGSTKRAYADARYLRKKLLREIPKQ